MNAAIGSLAGVVISLIVVYGKNDKKHRKAEHDAIKANTKHNFFSCCRDIIKQGYRTEVDDENLESLWYAYRGLGLNGRGESKYNECKKLPLMVE